VVKRKLTKPITGSEYARRRRELMALMEENSIAILPSANEKVRNGDVPYRFRQDSDFQYLTGFNEPDSVIVLIPGREHGEALLFCRDRDDEHEKWHGPITGPDRAKQLFGVDDAFPVSDIDDILPGLIEGRSKLYYAMGSDPDFDHQVIEWVNSISESGHLGASPPGEFVQLEQYLHELRLYKSAGEIELMRRAAQASAAGHVRAMEAVHPGMMEYELEAELRYAFSRSGARDEAYPSIVGGGENACVMHYIENNQMLRDGDLVLVDAGCEFEGYASDLTRTYPINGRFSAEQKAVYEVVLKAQEAAIDAVQPGNTWDEPHDAAMWEITKGLIALGILTGDLEVLFEEEAYMPYCMHKTGHWLGMDVHDVGDYQVNDEWRVLEPGMVTTIEPGLYFDASIESVPVAYCGIGVRIEDDVLVTKYGHDVLTDAAPKTVLGIEALMKNELEVRSDG
jgi:Xaa-Pro aminopeptidase